MQQRARYGRMSSIENRIQNIRQSIMKHAVAMKEKAKKQGFEFKRFSVFGKNFQKFSAKLTEDEFIWKIVGSRNIGRSIEREVRFEIFQEDGKGLFDGDRLFEIAKILV